MVASSEDRAALLREDEGSSFWNRCAKAAFGSTEYTQRDSDEQQVDQQGDNKSGGTVVTNSSAAVAAMAQRAAATMASAAATTTKTADDLADTVSSASLAAVSEVEKVSMEPGPFSSKPASELQRPSAMSNVELLVREQTGAIAKEITIAAAEDPTAELKNTVPEVWSSEEKISPAREQIFSTALEALSVSAKMQPNMLLSPPDTYQLDDRASRKHPEGVEAGNGVEWVTALGSRALGTTVSFFKADDEREKVRRQVVPAIFLLCLGNIPRTSTCDILSTCVALIDPPSRELWGIVGTKTIPDTTESVQYGVLDRSSERKQADQKSESRQAKSTGKPDTERLQPSDAETSKVRQLAQLRFPEMAPAEALCQIGVLLKSEGQLRDALTAFSLAMEVHDVDLEGRSFDTTSDIKIAVDADIWYAQPKEINLFLFSCPHSPLKSHSLIFIFRIMAGSYNLGITLLDSGFADEAVPQLERAVSLRPDDADAYAGLGASLALLARYDEASGAFRRALELDPLEIDTHCRLAESLHSAGAFNAAVDAVRTGLEIDGSAPELHCRLGVSLAGLGLLEPAVEALQVALQLDEDHSEAHYHSGRVLQCLGKIESANDHFRLAIDVDANHSLARVGLAEGHYAMGDYNAAHEAYSQALRFNSRNAAALHGLGATALMLDRPLAAERIFEVLTELSPNDPRGWLGRGASAERQPEGFSRALASYEALLQVVDKEHYGAHLAIAHIRAFRGEHQAAIKFYRWCLERQPSDRDALVR
jgi:tetratricopeptide (TPR) repeat protein